MNNKENIDKIEDRYFEIIIDDYYFETEIQDYFEKEKLKGGEFKFETKK